MKKIIILLLVYLNISGCTQINQPFPIEPDPSLVPSPSSFNQVLKYITSDSIEERIIGMWSIIKYPANEINVAVPYIIDNLYFQQNSNIRKNAARVLGELGEIGEESVPDLILVMQNDNSYDVKESCAITLGKIGDKTAIPALVENVFAYKENDFKTEKLAVFSAKSISNILYLNFPDADIEGYSSNKDGIPFLIIDAKEWWETSGKYQKWQ